MSKGEVNDKIRRCIKEENRALREAYDAIGSFEGVYKPKPAIIPIWGAQAVKLEATHDRRRGPASLLDLVVPEEVKS